jgi:hypothetical protein
MAVFEDDHNLAGSSFARVVLGGRGGDSQRQNRTGDESNDKLAHRVLLRNGG